MLVFWFDWVADSVTIITGSVVVVSIMKIPNNQPLKI